MKEDRKRPRPIATAWGGSEWRGGPLSDGSACQWNASGRMDSDKLENNR